MSSERNQMQSAGSLRTNQFEQLNNRCEEMIRSHDQVMMDVEQLAMSYLQLRRENEPMYDLCLEVNVQLSHLKRWLEEMQAELKNPSYVLPSVQTIQRQSASQ
jgi:hypothetical protein